MVYSFQKFEFLFIIYLSSDVKNLYLIYIFKKKMDSQDEINVHSKKLIYIYIYNLEACQIVLHNAVIHDGT